MKKEKSSVTAASTKKTQVKGEPSKTPRSKEAVAEALPYTGVKFWKDVKHSSFDVESLGLSTEAQKSLTAVATAGVSNPLMILTFYNELPSDSAKKYFFFQFMRQLHKKQESSSFKREDVVGYLFTLDAVMLEGIIHDEPYLMQWVPAKYQTDALIERALAYVLTENPYNESTLVKNLKSIPEKWIPFILPLYPKCYSVIPEEYHTEELALAVVTHDDRNIKDIPAPHPRSVMEVALKGWVNALAYIQPADPDDIHDLAKFAMEHSLNSFGVYASRVKGAVSPELFALYRQKCTESNYYPSYGVDEMQLTDAELYRMLKKNPLWIESYRIFIRMSYSVMKRVLEEKLFRNSIHLSDGEHTEANFRILKAMSDDQLRLVFDNYDHNRFSDFYHVVVGRYHDLAFFNRLVNVEPTITLWVPQSDMCEDWYRTALARDISLASLYDKMTPTLENIMLSLAAKALSETK